MGGALGIPLFDAHCDTAWAVFAGGGSLRSNALHTDLERAVKFSPRAQVFAIWGEGLRAETYESILAGLLLEFEKNSDILTLCLSAGDAGRAARDGKTAAFISVEGAEQLGCSVEGLEKAYSAGVRLVNLCWNYDNALCGAQLGESRGGLTAPGREFVAAAQEMGVAVDLSHISDAAFWEVLELAKKPALASHSNSRAICGFPRNITDGQFRAIMGAGGVVGVNFCPDFLKNDGCAGIGDIIAHIEHYMSLGGEKTVCLGGDLDGIDSLPEGFRGVQDYDLVYEALLKRGYAEGLVRDIFYNNLIDYLERAL